MPESSELSPSYNRILDAARTLFIDQGFTATSMEAIAQRAEVVRATVYNNFQDKEAILAEIMRRYVEGYVEIPKRLRARARPEQTSFELIRDMISSATQWRIENAELRPLIDVATQLPDSPWRQLKASTDEAMLSWIREIHHQDAGRGLIRPGLDLDFATSALYSMIESFITSFDLRVGRRRVEDAVNQLVSLYWHALYRVEPTG